MIPASVSEPVIDALPPRSVLPDTSNMFPVVEVAEAPMTTTWVGSASTIARLLLVVAHALLPPLPELSVPHDGTPPETLSTCPEEPTPSFESVFAAEAYNKSPVV